MTRCVTVSIVSGILFGIMDGLISANPLATRLYAVPVNTLLYVLVAGLGEMLVLGILYGLALRPPL